VYIPRNEQFMFILVAMLWLFYFQYISILCLYITLNFYINSYNVQKCQTCQNFVHKKLKTKQKKLGMKSCDFFIGQKPKFANFAGEEKIFNPGLYFTRYTF
jgi:hypothetical protein